MVVEGTRIIVDALASGLKPLTVFVTNEELMNGLEEYRHILSANNCPIYRVALKDLSTWSSLTTHPGITVIFERPQEVPPPKNSLPITVICDSIREPNNLGSICRVSAALPCAQVIVMKGCADPWEAKCLRGGSGGQFHIPIEYPVKWEDLMASVGSGESKVLLADNNTLKPLGDVQVRTIDDVLLSGKEKGNIFIVIGGETHGISAEAYA